ncbi:MAG: alpha/beta hydrolase [Bacteroidota bacterium]
MKYLLLPFFTLSIFYHLTAQNDNQLSMQDWQYPYDVHKIRFSDSLEIAYVDEGKGKCTLLFIHGLGSNLKAWSKNIDELKKDYRCIALDLPGYGKSSRGDYAFDMDFFANAVRGFIDQLKLKNVVLIGHSMGGQIAVQTVLNSQEKLEKLILTAPAGFETFTDKEKKWFQNIYTPVVVKATPETQIVKNFQLNFHRMPDDAQFMIDDRLLMRKTIEYDHYCNMMPRCVMGMLNQPIADQLPNIALPTLIIFGENDLLIPNKFLHPSLTPLAVAKSGQERIPNSKVEMIPLAGHFVQWEKAEAVNALLFDFLKK